MNIPSGIYMFDIGEDFLVPLRYTGTTASGGRRVLMLVSDEQRVDLGNRCVVCKSWAPIPLRYALHVMPETEATGAEAPLARGSDAIDYRDEAVGARKGS